MRVLFVHTSTHVHTNHKGVIKLYGKGTHPTKKAKNADGHGQTKIIILELNNTGCRRYLLGGIQCRWCVLGGIRVGGTSWAVSRGYGIHSAVIGNYSYGGIILAVLKYGDTF